eukprot:jgi/Mesvir1/14640/Mv05310-RA.1
MMQTWFRPSDDFLIGGVVNGIRAYNPWIKPADTYAMKGSDVSSIPPPALRDVPTRSEEGSLREKYEEDVRRLINDYDEDMNSEESTNAQNGLTKDFHMRLEELQRRLDEALEARDRHKADRYHVAEELDRHRAERQRLDGEFRKPGLESGVVRAPLRDQEEKAEERQRELEKHAMELESRAGDTIAELQSARDRIEQLETALKDSDNLLIQESDRKAKNAREMREQLNTTELELRLANESLDLLTDKYEKQLLADREELLLKADEAMKALVSQHEAEMDAANKELASRTANLIALVDKYKSDTGDAKALTNENIRQAKLANKSLEANIRALETQHKTEIQERQAQIRQMETRVAELEYKMRESDGAWQAKQRALIAEHETVLSEAARREGALREQIEEATAKQEETRGELDKANEIVAKLEKEKASLQAAIAEESTVELREKLNTVSMGVKNGADIIARLEERLESRQKEAEMMQEKLADLEQKRLAEAKHVEEMKGEHESRVEQLKRYLQMQTEEAASKDIQMQESLEAARAELARITTDKKSLEDRLESMTEHGKLKGDELTELNEGLAGMEMRIREKEAEIERLKEESKRQREFERMADEAQKALREEYDKERAGDREKNQTELSRLNDIIERLRGDISNKDGDVASKEEQLKKALSAQLELEDQHKKSAQRLNESHAEELARLREEHARLRKASIDGMRRAWDEEKNTLREEHKTQVEQLTQNLQKQTEEAESKENQIQKSLEAARAELVQIKGEKTTLETRLESMTEHGKLNGDELTDLNKGLADMEMEIREKEAEIEMLHKRRIQTSEGVR